LLRTNYTNQSPAELWRTYIADGGRASLQRTEKRFASQTDSPSLDARIEAHIFVCFLAYCLNVTLKQIAKHKAPGLTPRSIWNSSKKSDD